jgi:hypothetical protein
MLLECKTISNPMYAESTTRTREHHQENQHLVTEFRDRLANSASGIPRFFWPDEIMMMDGIGTFSRITTGTSA